MHRNSRSTASFKAAVILLPLLFLAGCAVLTVDVDVYKGALANQPDVQTKQLCAMTMAAKPILQGLSNTLSTVIDSTPKPNDGGTMQAKNQEDVQLLQTVASILSLYDDKSTNTASTLNQALLEATNTLSEFHISPGGEAQTNENTKLLRKFREHVQVFADSALAPNQKPFPSLSPSVTTKLTHLKKKADKLVTENNENSTPPAEQLKQAKEMLDDMLLMKDSIIAASLHGGRLDDGIETIISRYLNDAASNLIRDETSKKYRKQVAITTVDFAEKVKFIADNQLSRSGTASDRYRVSRHVRALEAIGNSILSLADALQERFTYDSTVEIPSPNQYALFTNANSYLSHAVGTTNLFRIPDTSTASNTLQQQDLVIEELKDIHITATLEGNTNLANRARAAIDLATTYRSDHIYILPTMAYLRSSYPATSLQGNDDGLWRNMLERHAWHSLPSPFDELVANAGKKNDAEIQAEIDKQFWQSINRIRVAGSGITSYVITKDDIGNWYVKSYTADPSPIIEGAKNLALNTAVPAAAAKNLPVTGKTATTNVEPGLLARELRIITDTYAAQTLEDGTNILLATTNLIDDLKLQLGDLPPPAFTNMFTNTRLFSPAESIPVLFSNAPMIAPRTEFPFTNSAPGVFSNATTTSFVGGLITNLPSRGAQSPTWFEPFTNNSISGSGTIFANSRSVASTNPFPAFSFSDQAALTTNYTLSVAFLYTNTSANTTLVFIANQLITFTNAYLRTNLLPQTFIASDLSYATNGIGSTDPVVGTFHDTATNVLTEATVFINTAAQMITNTLFASITYPTAGQYTNIVVWTITNTITNYLRFEVTNALVLSTTNTFNNTNSVTVVPASGVSLGFLETEYNRLVANATTNLMTKLLSPTAATNAIAIANDELRLLKQWDEVVNKISLSGTADQKRIILQYVAPRLRSLAKKRMDTLRPYADGLKLLSQSQQ